MANDLLNTAIREAGLDLDQVAEIAGVDPRTAQRWLAGRVPHPRYRHKLAVHLGLEEHELWPETGRARGKTALGEITAAYPRRSDPDAPDWRALLRSAHQQIDMLGYSLQHVAQARQIIKALADKARDGCPIRIALIAPASGPAIAADQQQRPPGLLTSRIQVSQRRLAPLIGTPGIELRQHHVATTHTILRFDDHTLLTIHLYGTPGFQAPLLHLRRRHDYGLFDQLAKHFDDVWLAALPLSGPDDQPAVVTSDTVKAAAERDEFLDSSTTSGAPPGNPRRPAWSRFDPESRPSTTPGRHGNGTSHPDHRPSCLNPIRSHSPGQPLLARVLPLTPPKLDPLQPESTLSGRGQRRNAGTSSQNARDPTTRQTTPQLVPAPSRPTGGP